VSRLDEEARSAAIANAAADLIQPPIPLALLRLCAAVSRRSDRIRLFGCVLSRICILRSAGGVLPGHGTGSEQSTGGQRNE
jgi:hypothetical protein